MDLYRLSKKRPGLSGILFLPLVFLSFVLSLGIGTEYVFHQARLAGWDLGRHSWFSIMVWVIAPDLRGLDPLITRGLHLTFLILGILLIGVYILRASRQKFLRETDTHGSARWATFKDIEEAGLIKQEHGIYIGSYRKPWSFASYFLRDNSDTHAIVVAPTGSGKGVSLVIPNLLSWRESVIVHDLKGENYNITSGYRKTVLGQNVFKFDPSCDDGTGARYNPLYEIRKGRNEVKDTQAIVDMIIDPDGKGKPSHWDKTADAFLCGVILHILYAKPQKSLAGLLHTLSKPGQGIRDLLEEMLSTEHDPGETAGWVDPGTGLPTRRHPMIASVAQEMKNKENPELSGVVSTATSLLSLYRDQVVAENTSESDFKIEDLMKGDRPSSLYIVVAPSEQKRVYPLTRLLMNQFCTRLMENKDTSNRMNLNGHKHRLLFMLDEFASLGRLDVFQNSLSYMRGYGIRAFIICQDLEQLTEKYGVNNTILGQCKTKIFFATNSDVTAARISRLAGESTVLKRSKSYSEANSGQVNEGMSEVRRQLLTPDEATRLPSDTVFIRIEGQQPLLVKKINYFKNAEFLQRASINRVAQSDRLIRVSVSDTVPAAPPAEPILPPHAQDIRQIDSHDIPLPAQEVL